jgi:Metallo-beta-lactamase superfamily
LFAILKSDFHSPGTAEGGFAPRSPPAIVSQAVFNGESSKTEVLKNIQGDTDENTMLWIPRQRILIAGDVLFNDMHLYTAETDSKAREKWLNSLKLNSLNKIRELKASVVVPGQSKLGAPLNASTAVDFTENYLSVFEEKLSQRSG